MPRDRKYNSVKIFGETIALQNVDWKVQNKPKLFRYHLHYFGYLAHCDRKTGIGLIQDWIIKNPPGRVDGWEPYPTSLRVVNWIKFILRIRYTSNEEIKKSLFIQKEWLYLRRELHLLANHYFKNLVALLYLSIFFKDDKVYKYAINNIHKQIGEQTESGLHFEYSPTYHAIFTQDLVDIYNLLKSYSLQPNLQRSLKSMIPDGIHWAVRLSSADQYIPIGDVNYQDCPSLGQLVSQADHLGILKIKSESENSSSIYPELRSGNVRILLINIPFNPPYNPAHSHCDKLSLLLWYNDNPVLVDTGNFNYENTDERIYSRSVSAHNTIQIDNRQQAEIWDVFRVGARGTIHTRHISETEILALYKYKGATHIRHIIKSNSGFTINDEIICSGNHRFRYYLHINPDLAFEICNNKIHFLDSDIFIRLPKGEVELNQTDYYPAMYRKRIKSTVVINGNFQNRMILETKILV